jgi:hypothetical protein
MRGWRSLTLALLAPLAIPTLAGAHTDDDVTVTSLKEFRIPLRVSQESRDQGIKEQRLYVSRNKGKTWELAGHVGPANRYIIYKAPGDGLYWFQAQLVLKDGTMDPKEIAPSAWGIKVRVDSNSKFTTQPPSLQSLQRAIETLRAHLDFLESRLAELEAREKKRK